MDFGGLLEAEQRFAPVASVRVTAGQEVGLGNPHAVFILSELYLGNRNNHCAQTLTQAVADVKRIRAALGREGLTQRRKGAKRTDAARSSWRLGALA